MPLKIAFIVTTHDPQRPWIVLATRQDSVEVSEAAEFWPWAQATWPAPKYAVRVVSGL